METLEILGFFCALLVGVSMGLLGGGGSILAVPIFAYLFKLDSVTSTAYSLFVVGIIALFSGVQKSYQKLVNWPLAINMGLPAIFGVWCMRKIFLPALPEELIDIQGFVLTKRMAMFGFFAILMALSAISMLHDTRNNVKSNRTQPNAAVLAMQGLMLGFITGFVGAGGGFLIIPALILMAGLEVKTAIGTSLVIIALNSLIGFLLGDALEIEVDWGFLLSFASVAFVGMYIGNLISKRLNSAQLKVGFAYFIIFMSLLIFYLEFLQ